MGTSHTSATPSPHVQHAQTPTSGNHAYKKRLYLSHPPPDEVKRRTRVTRYIPPAPVECMPIILPEPEPERCPTPPPLCLPEPDPIDVISVDVDDENEPHKCRSTKSSSRRSRSRERTTREREVYIERERLVPVPVHVPVPVPVREEPRYHTFRYVDAPRLPERRMIEDDTLKISIQDRHAVREYDDYYYQR